MIKSQLFKSYQYLCLFRLFEDILVSIKCLNNDYTEGEKSDMQIKWSMTYGYVTKYFSELHAISHKTLLFMK